MEQFEIWKLRSERGQPTEGVLVIVLQHKLFMDLDTRVVAPLREEAELPALGRVRPSIKLGRKRLRLIVDRLSVVRKRDLIERIGNAESAKEAIKRAVDELVLGI